MSRSQFIEDMFEAHMFLILGIVILSILSILLFIRAGPLLLLVDVRLWLLYVVSVVGWILLIVGIQRFMRAALDLETSWGAPPSPSGDALNRLQALQKTRRRILSTRVVPIGLFVILLLVAILWL